VLILESQALNFLLEIENASELAHAVDKLIKDSKLRADLGAGAAEMAARHRGATRKAVTGILTWQDLAVPRVVPGAWTRPLLWLLSRIWIVATEGKRGKDTLLSRHLNTPVISVGGISMGGAGSWALPGPK